MTALEIHQIEQRRITVVMSCYVMFLPVVVPCSHFGKQRVACRTWRRCDYRSLRLNKTNIITFLLCWHFFFSSRKLLTFAALQVSWCISLYSSPFCFSGSIKISFGASGAWEHFIRGTRIDLLQLCLNGRPSLCHELVAASVQDHVQIHRGGSDAQTTRRSWPHYVLPIGESKVRCGFPDVLKIMEKKSQTDSDV